MELYLFRVCRREETGSTDDGRIVDGLRTRTVDARQVLSTLRAEHLP